MLSQQLILTLADTAGGNPVSDLANQFGVEGPILLAQIVNFLIVMFLLYWFGFKPVLATMNERQQEIQAGLDRAEEMKQKLAEAEEKQKEMLKEASRKAKKTVEDARQAAREYEEKQTHEANERAAALVTKAEESIEMERRKMLSEVRDEISRLVVLTTSRVLQKELSEDERNRFLKTAAEDLQKN